MKYAISNAAGSVAAAATADAAAILQKWSMAQWLNGTRACVRVCVRVHFRYATVGIVVKR